MFLLAKNLVFKHFFGDLFEIVFSDLFPAKFVRFVQADILAHNPCKEHDALDDLRVAHHMILEQVVHQAFEMIRVVEHFCNYMHRPVLGFNFA